MSAFAAVLTTKEAQCPTQCSRDEPLLAFLTSLWSQCSQRCAKPCQSNMQPNCKHDLCKLTFASSCCLIGVLALLLASSWQDVWQFVASVQGCEKLVCQLKWLLTLAWVMQGIVFSVRPPKKSWKNIANLSGGEKTLSSLSLVFALHHYKPTPLYVMDEIDAALGELLSC